MILDELDIELLDLTVKEKNLCERYMVHFNGTRAAVEAGYSKHSARTLAAQTLSKRNVKAYLDHLKAVLAKEVEISKEMVLKEWMAIAFTDVKEFVDGEGNKILPHKLNDNAAKAIQDFSLNEFIIYDKEGNEKNKSITANYTKVNKAKALEWIGKLMGYEENQKNNAPVTAEINIEFV